MEILLSKAVIVLIWISNTILETVNFSRHARIGDVIQFKCMVTQNELCRPERSRSSFSSASEASSIN